MKTAIFSRSWIMSKRIFFSICPSPWGLLGHAIILLKSSSRTASCDTSLVVKSGGVDCRRRRRNVYDKKPQRYAKDNRTAHLTARNDKSVAYATNSKRLYSTFCTVEVNYWQTRSIGRPLCNSRWATCYSASSRSVVDASPLPISQRWSPQANPTARHLANTARPRIRVGVSRDMPVYFPSYSFSLDRLRLRHWCLVSRPGGLPVQRRSPISTNRA